MDSKKIEISYKEMLNSIKELTDGKDEGHFAIKFTALVSIDVMTRWSTAQDIYMKKILKICQNNDLDINDLKTALMDLKINLSDDEIYELFESYKF